MPKYPNFDGLSDGAALVQDAPTEAEASFQLKHIAGRADGAIAAKYRELVSGAVALTTRRAD